MLNERKKIAKKFNQFCNGVASNLCVELAMDIQYWFFLVLRFYATQRSVNASPQVRREFAALYTDVNKRMERHGMLCQTPQLFTNRRDSRHIFKIHKKKRRIV